MKKSHKRFIKKFKKYLKNSPDLRVTQALYNVGVNLCTDPQGPHPHFLIDNYNETDEVILKRMKKVMKKSWEGANEIVKETVVENEKS